MEKDYLIKFICRNQRCSKVYNNNGNKVPASCSCGWTKFNTKYELINQEPQIDVKALIKEIEASKFGVKAIDNLKEMINAN